MSLLNRLPELPKEIWDEVPNLYESSIGKVDEMFSGWFATNKPDFDPDKAAVLDKLIDWMYGTMEAMKKVENYGNYTPKRGLEFNLFMTAALGGYNDTGLLNSEFGPEGALGDYDDIINLAKDIREGIDPVFLIFSNREKKSGNGEQISIEDWLYDPQMGADAMVSLFDKLRVEAAVYNALKSSYGVTVELPT